MPEASSEYIFDSSKCDKQMKTNFYLLLILLLTFSFGNAQATPKAVEVEINNTVSVSNDDEKINTTNVETTTNENDSLLIDAKTLRQSIARGTSDIRIYLIRERNEGNISLVFPKIHKAVKA